MKVKEATELLERFHEYASNKMKNGEEDIFIHASVLDAIKLLLRLINQINVLK